MLRLRSILRTTAQMNAYGEGVIDLAKELSQLAQFLEIRKLAQRFRKKSSFQGRRGDPDLIYRFKMV